MTLRPQALPPVPEATVAAVQAAFPKGNLYVALRIEFGTLYDDQLFADLYPRSARGGLTHQSLSWRALQRMSSPQSSELATMKSNTSRVILRPKFGRELSPNAPAAPRSTPTTYGQPSVS
jgi:hypothetical protein